MRRVIRPVATFATVASVIAVTASAVASWLAFTPVARAGEFAYSGEHGPSHWSHLDAAWETCDTGRAQSPVDLKRARTSGTLPVRYSATKGSIFNNGHTVEVETEGDNVLSIGGVDYRLVQLHFHAASEHVVDGRGYDMEMHLVHRSADGRLAVIGVFMQRGESSGSLAALFDSLPEDVGVHHPLPAAFHPLHLLPASRRHYRYEGSLTTPPCTEGVHWIVMQQPLTITDEHVAHFVEHVHFNARPVQRTIK